MYTRWFYYFSDIKYRSGNYVFESKEEGNTGKNLVIKLLKNNKLEVINAGDLSGIYIPGKARNYD